MNLANATLLGLACYYAFQMISGASARARTRWLVLPDAHAGASRALPALRSSGSLGGYRHRTPPAVPAPHRAGSVTRTFLATYIGMFALLLVLFETRVKYTEGAIRRLFGFMFSYGGRTVFLIFLGAICFGMLSDKYKDSNVRSGRACAPPLLSPAGRRMG